MGHWKPVLLLVLLTLTSGYGNLNLAKDEEAVFDYKAIVKAGTTDPQSYASEFYLSGKLHLQEDGLEVGAKFNDLKYKVYNGKRYYSHENEIKEQPLPKDAEDILLPFKIIYKDNHQVKAIVTDKNEKTFARNMHKAITAIFQLDIEKLNFNNYNPQAFITEENTIYGKTMVSYNALSSPEEIMVRKMHEMESIRPMSQVEVFSKPSYEKLMSHESHQVYILRKHREYFIADYIESSGAVFFYPFQVKSESQYVSVNITLQFEGIVPVKKRFEVENPQVDNNLVYQMIDPSVESSSLNDIMIGRRFTDIKKFIPVVEKMLTEIKDYLHTNPLHTETPDIKRSQLINSIVSFLTFFDKKTIESMYEAISFKTTEKEILHQILPLVGTHASILLVKKIIHDKKVEDDVAIHMLHNLPDHVNVPNEQMLNDMEDMMSWGDEIDMHVRHSAILCFASLIHKTFQFQVSTESSFSGQHYQEISKRNKDVNMINQYHDAAIKLAEERPIYNNYANSFFDKIESTEDSETKLLYVNALSNTKLPIILDLLLPIVTGQVKVEPKTRFDAMLATSQIVLSNSDKVFKIFWPIFSDWSELPEIRVLAYCFTINSRPSITRLLNIHWQMSVEPNVELRHYHYTYLKSMSLSTDPRQEAFRLNAAQILKLTRKPNEHGHSFYDQTSYVDGKYGFGGTLQNVFFNGEDTKVFVFTLSSNIFNMPSNYYEVFLRINGLRGDMFNKLYLNLEGTAQLFSFDKFWNFYASIIDNKDVSVELTIRHNDRIVQLNYFEGEDLKHLKHAFSWLFEDQLFTKVKNSISIHYDMSTKMVFPTDIGMPAMLEILMPVVHHNHINTKKDTTSTAVNFHFDNRYHISRHTCYGLSFYNPVIDVWQGVNRYVSYNFEFPLFMDLSVNPQQRTVRISMRRHKDDDKNIIGIRSHATTMTFFKDDLNHDILKQSCLNCRHFTTVTTRGDYRHNYTLYQTEGYNTGSKYRLAVYDSDYSKHHHGFHRTTERIINTDSKQFDSPIGYVYAIIKHLHTFMVVKPTVGTQGLLFTVSPSADMPVSQIDLTFRINTELVQEKDQFLPGVKFNTRLTWALRNKEKSIKTWDINANIDLNPGHTVSNTKVNVTRIVPGQKDYKVCTEYAKKWTEHGVNGHFIGAMGKSIDGKCDKDAFTVEINMVGDQIEGQQTPHHVYEICNPYDHYLQTDYHSLKCSAQHASIRKFVYDIKTSNDITAEFRQVFYSIISKIKAMYNQEGMFEKTIENKLTETNHMKIKVEYPIDLQKDEMNIEFVTSNEAFEFANIPLHSLSYFGFYPDNIHYSKLYMIMHRIGMMRTCIARSDGVRYTYKGRQQYISFKIPNEWTLYVGDSENDAHHGIYLKKMENHMIALKAVHGSETVEIYPEGEHGEHFKIFVNGKEVSDDVDFHSAKWFAFLIRPHTHNIIMTTFHFHLHMEHKGDHVIIQVPRVEGYNFYGKCV